MVAKFFYVVHLDRAKFSVAAENVEDFLGVEGTAKLNEMQQELVDSALSEVKKDRKSLEIHPPRGDDATLRFDDADTAHRFAAALHQLTRVHNAKTKPRGQCWFRVACAHGELSFNDQAGKYLDGCVLTEAARLLTAKPPGRVLVDPATYKALSSEFQGCYENEEKVSGKPHDLAAFSCHQWQAVPEEELAGFFEYYRQGKDRSSVASENEATVTAAMVNDLFKRLTHKEDFLPQIINEIIPVDHRPSIYLKPIKIQNEIVKWCSDDGLDTLEKLYDILNKLINDQNLKKSKPL
jgi:hypothetical protein